MPFIDWINKQQAREAARSVPVHLLEQRAVYGDPAMARDNLLIQGDNLLALKALMPVYAGRVKCIFIDPPYNTQSAFEHYDDKLEHSQWLSMMYPRLVMLRDLLSEDGSIWITIDDNEAHYLKVVLDEIFGRSQFVANIVWQSKDTPGNNATGIAETHNHVIGYRRGAGFKARLLDRDEKQRAYYSNPDGDPRGDWLAAPLTRAEHRDRDYYPLPNPQGREVLPPKGSSWRRPPTKLRQLIADNRVWWGKSGDAEFPMEKKFLAEAKAGVVNKTWWPYEFAGSTRNASAELKALFEGRKVFDTPKPEKLVYRILELATDEGDLVMDSFLGSGTTAAVAHKMRRQWIGIEEGDHVLAHCVPRLQKVLAGEQGGISKHVDWTGGGGFRLCALGQAAFAAGGRINPLVRFPTLAGFIWHYETATATPAEFSEPLLGVHNGTAYFLLFNGILGDRRPDGGNVLTHSIMRHLSERYPHDGPRVVYGESTRIGEARLAADRVTFKQIPYDIRMR